MDKAGIAFLILICVLVAIALSILAIRPGADVAPPPSPTIVPSN